MTSSGDGARDLQSSPYELWRQAGCGTDRFDRHEYRRLLLEHGLLVPGEPKPLPCGWPQRKVPADPDDRSEPAR